jgi:hypothetical protein
MANAYNPYTAPPHSVTVQGAYEPFDLQVSRGQIMGHQDILVSGSNISLGTSYSTVWSQAGLYAYLSTAAVMEISSSSASDTAAGTGARTVTIYGLDANYNQINETVSLNGQTAVNTTNSYLRVFHLLVNTAGSGGAAAGTIYAGTGTVTAGVPAVVYGSYSSVGGSSACIFTIPAGYTGYVYDFSVSFGSTSANVFARIGLYARPNGGVFDNSLQGVAGNGGSFVTPLSYPLSFPEKTDIEIRGQGTTAGGTITANFTLVLIKNDSQSA